MSPTLRRYALLLAVLGLPCLVQQLSGPPPRLDADAVEYYSHVRSLYFDGDLDFANEFEHFGILDRGDKRQPTATGHRRTIFSVGPALIWMPFYAIGDGVARLAGAVEDGYSPYHIRAVALASLFYGLCGLLLVFRLLLRLFTPGPAFWTTLLLLYGTFLYWYLVGEPVMSHSGSFFLSALVLTLFWDGGERLSPLRGALLGLGIGVAATVRWQNGVLLLLPAARLLPRLTRAPRRSVGIGLLTLVCFGLGALPQLLAWKAIFGSYLLADPPHGADFLRLDHPYVLETLFSSRHGLLYWTPILWLGFLGYLPLLRRQPRLAAILLAPIAVMSYVNVCSGDWWAGGSFSNRRFDSLLPLLALGLGAALAQIQAWVARRPALAIAAGGAALTLWNLLLMTQYGRDRIPRDDTVSFAQVAENNADLLSEWAGSPLAWPANWIFAWRHDLPAQKYDLMVGSYLFYRQNNLGGVIDLGDDRVDPGLLGEGWTGRRLCAAGETPVCRGLEGSARLFAPLDVPRDLAVTIRATGSGTLRVTVNGHPVGAVPLTRELRGFRLRAPRGIWRRELNEVTLTPDAGAEVLVDKLVFEP
jgi:hypothetical protein